MIKSGLEDFKDKRVLMLQGPVGPFFSRLSRDLAEVNATVVKINFNGGDWLFSTMARHYRTINFRGSVQEWPTYLESILQIERIDTILLFGDCRNLHTYAIDIAKQFKIRLGVFEEGYIRPDHITLEVEGVNYNSQLPKKAEFYLSRKAEDIPTKGPLGSTYLMTAIWSIIYYVASDMGRIYFSRYIHHRRLGVTDARYWLISYIRKATYKVSECGVLKIFENTNIKRVFLAPLQTSGDFQVSVHSPFDSVEQYIKMLVCSFSSNSTTDSALLIKHHPLDRGYSNYRALIADLSRRYGLQGRLHYIHDQHLPSLLSRVSGVVVINSTVGLSAIGEGKPVKVCGNAIYDIQGLTFQDSLDLFWTQSENFTPNTKLFEAFRNYLLCHSQHQGSFYRRHPEARNKSGVIWVNHGISPPHRRAEVAGGHTTDLQGIRMQ